MSKELEELDKMMKQIVKKQNKRSHGIERIIHCEPQVSNPGCGPEPCLYSLLMDYYRPHVDDVEGAISDYIEALKRQA